MVLRSRLTLRVLLVAFAIALGSPFDAHGAETVAAPAGPTGAKPGQEPQAPSSQLGSVSPLVYGPPPLFDQLLYTLQELRKAGEELNRFARSVRAAGQTLAQQAARARDTVRPAVEEMAKRIGGQVAAGDDVSPLGAAQEALFDRLSSSLERTWDRLLSRVVLRKDLSDEERSQAEADLQYRRDATRLISVDRERAVEFYDKYVGKRVEEAVR